MVLYPGGSMLSATEKKVFQSFQRDEASAHLIYRRLARVVKDEHNSGILDRIAREEANHYQTLRDMTGVDIAPRRIKALLIVYLSRFAGATFALKLLERWEKAAQSAYQPVIDNHPSLKTMMEDEERHEQELLGMIAEERMEYIGSIVLGLNDALVELTGALAGFTFAFQNTRLIALSGVITGIAASLSMASSEFLSHRTEKEGKNALKAAIHTGIAYIVTVILLIIPYLLLPHYYWALSATMLMAISIILLFSAYVSVVKDLSFRRHSLEMTCLSLGVSILSFGMGVLVRKFLKVEI